jgi:ribosome maturation factor RimP
MSGRVVEVVTEMVSPMLEKMELDLVEITYRKEGPNWILRVAIDRPPEGVTIDDCERVTKALSKALDEVDPIETAYYLEVSSPGAERKLKDYSDLQKQIGRYLHLTLKQPVKGKDTLIGYLKGADENQMLVLENEDGLWEISYSQVSRARLAIKF